VYIRIRDFYSHSVLIYKVISYACFSDKFLFFLPILLQLRENLFIFRSYIFFCYVAYKKYTIFLKFTIKPFVVIMHTHSCDIVYEFKQMRSCLFLLFVFSIVALQMKRTRSSILFCHSVVCLIIVEIHDISLVTNTAAFFFLSIDCCITFCT
jgi:hypothetical protein